MASEVSARLLSYDDYARRSDPTRGEVVEGRFVVTPAPSGLHQLVVLRLAQRLQNHLDVRPTGTLFIAPYDVVLRAERPAIIVQPDLVFVAAASRHRLTPANLQGPPDLVVEVVSPTSVAMDTVKKRRLYAAHGVAEYWLVWPEAERVERYTFEAGGQFGKPALLEPGEVVTTPLLPGFALAIADLFAGLPEA